MKRSICMFMSVFAVASAGTALGAEFQPMGTLGIGGAGVARTYDAYAPYWNPAGLAFSDKTVSSRVDVSAGLKVNDGLADNVDRLSDLKFDNFSKISNTSSPQDVADTVKAITILNDIKEKKGTIAVNANAVFGFQVNHFAFGAFGTAEGFAQPEPDTVNILPQNDANAQVTPTQFAAPTIGAAPSDKFFDTSLRGEINTALTSHGFTAAESQGLINATDAQMAGSGMSPQQVADTLINMATTITSSTDPANAPTLDKNTTSVLTRSLAYIEFPLSYGHAINLGSFGTLGLGATVKVIAGRVYQSQTYLMKSGETVTSSDITKELTHNFKDSTNFGFDLGALWRYSDWFNLGIVAKNLNTPEFDAPDVKDKWGTVLVGSGGKVKLKPQVRMGVSFDPYKWLTLAADLDLTENETVVAAEGFKNRTVGGGFEWHEFSWFKLRGGMYSNLADGGIGPTATAGLTFGTKWVNMDIDGAYSLDTAQYKGKTYPQEARVQAQFNFLF